MAWLSLTELTNLNSGEGGSNLVDVKKFKFMGQDYPYVSGQAMRAYLKEAIRRNLAPDEFMCLPDAKGETCGDIGKCVQCDLFGFMIPKKKTLRKKRGENSPEEQADSERVAEEVGETAGGALTRISPVKVSPAIGQFPFFENSTLDFLTRRKPQEKAEERKGDIVNVELGKNLYKCGVDVDVHRVGTEEEFDTKNRSLILKSVVPEGESFTRIRKVLEAIKFISDYSKQARLLTDFTPDIICIAFQQKYSHRLQKMFDVQGYKGVNVHRVHEILSDVKAYSKSIHFGIMSDVVPQENEQDLIATVSKLGISIQRPDQAIQSSLELVK